VGGDEKPCPGVCCSLKTISVAVLRTSSKETVVSNRSSAERLVQVWPGTSTRESFGSPCDSRLFSSTLWSLFGSLISRGLGLVSAILIARILDRRDFGEYGMVQATVSTLGIFAGVGTSLTVTKHIAELRLLDAERAARILRLCNWIAWSAGVVMAAALFVFAPWLARHALNLSQLTVLLRVSALELLFDAVNGVQNGALAGFGAFRAIAQVNMIIGLISFPLAVLGALWSGVVGAVYSLVFTSMLGCLGNYATLRAHAARAGFGFRCSGVKRELGVVWSFSIPAMLGSAVTGPVGWALNALLVNQPGGYEQLGLYAAAARIKQIPEALLAMLAAPILPLLAEHFARRNVVTYRRILLYCLGLTATVIIPVSLLQLAAPNLTLLPFGRSYAGHGALVQWMMLHAVIIGVLTPLSSVVISMHRMWFSWAINLLFGALNLGLGWCLVSTYGVTGMAASTAISFLLANLPCAFFTMKHRPEYFTREAFLTVAAAVTVAGLACLIAGRYAVRSTAMITGIVAALGLLVFGIKMLRVYAKA
jgi:O-antigen/teichoic acid export membrane protein